MPPKKKLSKKEKARLEAEQAELLRIELEKEKLKKLEEERQRKQIERKQAEERQQQEIVENKLRRNQLKDSMAFLSHVQLTIEKIKQHDKEKCEWEKYMRCNGLPSGNCPSDLREYIHMWREDIEQRNSHDYNWLLKTNERTLLTQDTNIPDMSRTTLRNRRGNLGDIYARRIKEVLGILAEVDDSIVAEETAPNTVVDLLRLKSEIRIFLFKYLDEFSYKILSHVERDMEIDRQGVSKHIYSSDVFKSFVWALSVDAELRPIAKIIIADQNPPTEISFPTIEMDISFPPSVNLQNSALRGLWLNYDHFSDFCPSFYLRKSKSKKNNILKQTKREWIRRKEILKTMIDDITKEISMTTINDIMMDEDSSRTNASNAQRTFDLDKIYTEYEDDMNAMRRKAIGPDAMKLSETDVNLRKYRIIGGIYSIDYLDLPEQDKRLNATSFIRTVTYPDELCRKCFHEKYKPPSPPLPGVRRLPEEIEAEMRLVEASLEKLALVTVQLPNSVLWFEPPIACRWEISAEATESDVFDANKNTKESFGLTTISTRYENYQPDFRTVKKVKDFDLLNVPKGIDLHGLLEDFVVPQLPYDFDIHDEDINYDQCNVSDCHKNRISILDNIGNSTSLTELHPSFEVKKAVEILKEDCDEEKNINDFAHTYMFSQLLEDLNQYWKRQMPSFEDDDQSQILSSKSQTTVPSSASSMTPPHVIATTATRSPAHLLDPSILSAMSSYYSGIMFNRESDIPSAEAATMKVDDAENSSESDDDDDDNCNTEPVQVQRRFTDAEDENGRQPSGAALTKGKWSTRDVHDTKFNEDKLTIQFRAGRLGFFGFALNRYSNMPYQAWEIKPDMKNPGSILFSFTASIISLDMTITSEGYCVNSFQGGITDDLNNKMIGKTLSLNELKMILINAAVDIFPDEDAFCYTEGSCEKNYVMEMHLYACISTLGLSHNFGWSRWNLLAGSRTAVLLMRELIENKKVPNHSTLLVTPLKTSIIDCTEVSPSFSAVSITGMDYYADLHQLVQVYAQPCSLEKQKTMDPVLRDNAANILMSIRPLSFC